MHLHAQEKNPIFEISRWSRYSQRKSSKEVNKTSSITFCDLVPQGTIFDAPMLQSRNKEIMAANWALLRSNSHSFKKSLSLTLFNKNIFHVNMLKSVKFGGRLNVFKADFTKTSKSTPRNWSLDSPTRSEQYLPHNLSPMQSLPWTFTSGKLDFFEKFGPCRGAISGVSIMQLEGVTNRKTRKYRSDRWKRDPEWTEASKLKILFELENRSRDLNTPMGGSSIMNWIANNTWNEASAFSCGRPASAALTSR